ncbi:cell shape-determining protein MreB [Pedobacter cryophilus]|uniref:Cell shape-determining protein MreB n=1 Tax=Pedobacter cryophilus TaxID=2571271 RepID=A0A4U1BZY4_9SPHI|nr:cell shape-determining protein MreB [Pedobacter cryophilus]TKB98792.1 cell shape-determining protein MreB [Pedobacter cryophilus]
MKKINYLLMLLSVVFVLSSCNNGDENIVVPILEPEVIANNVSTNTTLTSDRVWILRGETHVQSGAVLTIQAGTIIKSDVSQKGALIIDKGARIEAVGTAASPIIFTSGVAAGSRAPGDWAGITIIGRAPTNRATVGIVEGGVSGQFGLDNIPTDNSGTLKYVRIEYAGIAVAQGSEVNALSLYAVGSGTTLDHIQISYAKDDAYEFFGGTVNGKYLISYGTSDDDFDFDNGYTGKIQFGVVLRRPELVDPTDQGNGVECDNESSVPTAGPSTPLTRPVLSNFTFLGSNGASNEAAQQHFANRFRRATQFVVVNSLYGGFKEAGVSMESEQTVSAYVAGTSIFKNNAVTAMKQPYLTNSATLNSAAFQVKAETEGNVTLANSAALLLSNPFNLSAPNFSPQTASPALLGTYVAADNSGFFTATTYRGAFAANDTWTNTWTNFNPNSSTY